MRLKNDLSEITLPGGQVLKPVLSGRLDGIPFSSGLDNDGTVRRAKERGLRYRRVQVLSRNLRGKTDLHRRPYAPVEYVFVECPASA